MAKRSSRIFIGNRVYIPVEVTAPSAELTLTQAAFRFGADDGSESLHTWLAAQNVNITRSAEDPAIIRIQVDTEGDQPSQQFKLQVKLTSDPDSRYRDVPIA